MASEARSDARDDPSIHGVEDGDAPVLAPFRPTGDPDETAVRLDGQAVRPHPSCYLGGNLPGLGVYEGHPIYLRHGHEDSKLPMGRQPSRRPRAESGTRASSLVPPKPNRGSTTLIVALSLSVTTRQ